MRMNVLDEASETVVPVKKGALSGVRVLDLSHVMAGPFAAMLLGDMGADVIKVEIPGRGDLSRGMDPQLDSGESGAFLAVNRNKRSVCIDLKTEQGREVFYALLDTADVLIENFRPGVTRRLGIDWDTLRARKPSLVYASISGFGQTGPYSSRGGFDLIAQGMSGLMSVTGVAGGEPVKCGIPVSDLGAGLFAVYGLLSALVASSATGEGQLVDTSLFEAGLGLSIWEATEFFHTGRTPVPTGSRHRLSAPYQAFRTRDGYITVGAETEHHWPVFCRVIGAAALADDPRFVTNAQRMANLGELEEILQGHLEQRTSEEWLSLLEEVGIPAGPINTVPEALSDSHTAARQMVVEMEHPTEGSVRALGPVVKLSGTPAQVRRAAPLLGQHTDEVLAELGMSEGQVAQLREAGAVA